MISRRYPQGMSILSEYNTPGGRISCWLAAFLCLDWKAEEEAEEDSTYLESDL